MADSLSSVGCSLLSPGDRVFVLCEKPSVARDLGGVLGASKGEGPFLVFPGGVISWAFGHLVGLVAPAVYTPAWAARSWDVLPMVPPDYRFLSEAQSDKVSHLAQLRALYCRSSVLVNACDAGREGELIWWEVMRHCGWGSDLAPGEPGPVRALRFWAQSNTPEGLAQAWAAMAPVETRLGLARAAYCRREADWLLGMNGSRAVALSFEAPLVGGKRATWSVGRVQTPVLALVCARDREIEQFVSKPFYEVRLECSSDTTPYEAVLLVPSGSVPFVAPDAQGAPKEPRAFLEPVEARSALDEILAGRPGPWALEDVETPSLENPPNLFSLTDLQKWCNRAWGWDAKRTLAAAQVAYEQAKTLSYPRTDACFLPRDAMPLADKVHGLLAPFLSARVSLPAFCVLPSASTRAGHVFDDSRLTDHYAIIPTGVVPEDLVSDAGKVWLAVVCRFFCAFAPAARLVSLRRRLLWRRHVAVASGKRYTSPGWVELDGLLAPLTGRKSKALPSFLPAVSSGSSDLLDARLHEGSTTPPKPLTEAMLLTLMENIHQRLDTDEEALHDVLMGKGLGTPATRAAIIDLLVTRSFLVREGRSGAPVLCATPVGRLLVDRLRSLSLGVLTSPDMTAHWEHTLLLMERGTAPLDRRAFLDGIVAEVHRIVEVLKAHAATQPTMAPPVELATLCPLSGKAVMESPDYWQFPGFSGRAYKQVAGRSVNLEDYVASLSGSPVVLEGFVSSKGKSFSAMLVPDSETARFVFRFPERQSTEAGVCPLTGKPVLDYGTYWMFPGRKERFWKTVAGREMTLGDYGKLVSDGNTPILSGFVSSKGAAFSAVLVFLPGDKIGFPPREASSSGGSVSTKPRGSSRRGRPSGKGGKGRP
jgi:DNA topoisomerase III